MSYETRVVDNEVNNSVVPHNRRDVTFGSSVQYTSSVVINLRKLQSELTSQHQHDKSALTELNQRFHLFVDRVHHLQTQNAKYIAAIAELKRRSSGSSHFDAQWDEHYFSTRSDLLVIHDGKIDCIWDYEMFQLQIAIYQQLIDIEQQWKGKRISLLEDELKKSASALITIRSSYGEVQRSVEGLHAECGNLFKHYMSLTHDWSSIKKQRNKWEFNSETLKKHVKFYKSISSYSKHEHDSSLSVQTEDATQYWTLELDSVVKRIRADFAAFYASLYRQMAEEYESKIVEMETNIKQELQYQQTERHEYSSTYQNTTTEYEKIQKSFSYEKETSFKLETTYSKLEAELKSLLLHNEQRYEAQSTELYNVQESIMAMVYDVDEIRSSKANLEAEIIVYRLLLDSSEGEKRVTVLDRTHIIATDMVGKISVKKSKNRSIEIKECSPTGSYISLSNTSSSKDIDLSRWLLTQKTDSKAKIRYTIPDGVQLARGKELRIYAKSSGANVTETSKYQRLVNTDLSSWGTGNIIETRLFNHHGDPEATHSKSIAL